MQLNTDDNKIMLFSLNDETGIYIWTNGIYKIEPDATGIQTILIVQTYDDILHPHPDSEPLEMYEDITEKEFLTALGIL